MLSQTVEYALRAIVCLANEAPTPRTSEQLVEVTQVPQAYLPKVMLSLNRGGLVRSQRGPNGGFTLAKAPDELSLLEVVNAVDPLQRITECPLRIQSHGANLCALHRRLDETVAMVEKVFRETSLADILAESTGSIPLCSDHAEAIVDLKIDT